MAITGIPTISAINNLKIAQVANALYGYVVGATTNNAVLADIASVGFDTTVNTYYTYSFGTSTAAAVAASVATNLGIVAGSHGLVQADVDAAVAYISAQITAAPGAEGAAVANTLTLWSGLTADATYGTAATAWNATVADAQAYTASGATADYAVGSAFTYPLTTGIDNMTGTSGADAFQAYIMDNANTLQDGDVLAGGAGADTLYADIGASQDFAITAQTSGIETVQIRAQSDDVDAAQNNPNGQGGAHIDAQRMSGVSQWESNNSRADVFIEDVRINSNVSTIAFVESDPGNVDLAVYFNQRNLVNTTASTSSLSLQVMDTVAAAAGLDPLLNSTYGAFTFTATDENGVETVVTLTSQAIQDAQTYDEMVTAFQDALDAQFGAGAATATTGDNFTVVDPASGTSCTGQSVVLTATGNITFTTPSGSGWSSSGVAPAASNFYTNWSTGGTGSTALVNTDIILDDVGLGSQGGALLVGGMSNGETSSSLGVERFNIEVRDNSQLTTINSTNNTLREVVIVNGVTSSSSTAYVTTTTDAGNLSVNGGGQVMQGANEGSAVGVHAGAGAAGFTDVRLIDASAMTGQFSFTAAVTSDSIDKYVNLEDTATSPTADVATNNTVGLGANFAYTGGANDDSMDVTIDSTVAASRSTIVSGQSDFTFAISGGAGNDSITVSIADTLAGGAEDWYNNQNFNNNITISGGAGNDTIWTPGAGDTTIDAGAGADLIFTDNTGAQAVTVVAGSPVNTPSGMGIWVFNTPSQALALDAATVLERDINDMRSDANDSYNLYNATMTVTFKGLVSSTITLSNSTTYKTTDLEINQAIKNAINNDATLSNLLVARDGPGNTLVVESLIDGTMATTDLAVTFAAPTTALSTAELAAVNTAWGTAYATGAELVAMGVITTALNAAGSDYVDVMATDGILEVTGANSTTTSDNYVTPGADNDIVVLGTTLGVDVGQSSNDVVVYASTFGNDVVVNFDATGMGVDYLSLVSLGGNLSTAGADFSNLEDGGGALNAVISNDTGSIMIDDLVTTDGVGSDNDSADNVKELFLDDATAGTMVYIAVSSGNVGTVYQVVDGTAATGDLTVTSMGSIDLADTLWGTLVAANFTIPGVTTNGLTTPPGVTLTTTAAAQTLTGTAMADTFTVVHTAAVITDLGAGDVFTVSAGNSMSATVSTSFVATAATSNAGTVTLTAAAGGATINMTAATGANGYTLAGAAGVDTLTGSVNADTITGAGGADVINPGEGIDTVTGGTGIDAITLTDVDNAVDTVVVNSALAADADTITGFAIAEDIMQFSIAGLGLTTPGDYAAGAAVAVTGAAGNGLAAGAASNHIVIDTAANIALMIDADSAWAGAAVAVATDTGAVYFDADADFSAGSVIIGTLPAGAYTAAEFAFIA